MSDIYDITAPNGKRYRIEANDGVTQEQALKKFQSLKAEEWAAYEVQDEPAQTPSRPAPAPVARPQEAAPVAAPAPGTITMQNGEEPVPLADVRDVGAIESNRSTGVQTTYTNSKANVPEIDDAIAALWLSGERDPAKFQAVIDPLRAKYPELADLPYNIDAKTIAAAQQYDAANRARGIDLQGRVFAPVTYETGIPDPLKPDTVLEQATAAAKRGTAGIGNSIVGLGALAADVVGADETADALLEEYINNQAAISYEYGNSMQTGDVEDVGSAFMYLADTLGELAPQLIGSMGLGYLGKEAATRTIRKGAEELIEAKIEQGMAREIAERQVADQLRKRAIAGAAAGSASSTVTQETGSTFGNTYMRTGEKAPMMSVMAGVASGSLDAILPMKVLTSFGGDALANQFKKKFLQRAATEGGKGFAIEGATEAAQTFITNLPAAVINGESPFTEEMFNEMYEAFWKGGIGGGTVSTVVAGAQQMAAPAADPVAAQFPTETTIIAPTAEVRNSKEFREQLDASTAQVQTVADQLTSTWTNAPTKVQALPNFVNEQDVDNDAIGVYMPDGSVLINTEEVLNQAKRRGVSPDAMVASVTFHESLGHHGLTQTFGAELDDVMDTFYTQGKPEFQEEVNKWIARNPEAYADGDPTGKYSREAYQQIRATEEVMAEIAEKEGLVTRDMYDRVADLVKRIARQMGIDWKYSSREVRSILAVAQRNVTQGDPTDETPGSVKNQIVFHGSGANFDKFDHSKMGTGEGQQVFGYGTYLTDEEKIANSYKEKLSDRATSFAGRRGPIWQLRDIADQKAEEAGINKEFFDLAFTVSTSMDKPTVTPKEIWFELAGPNDDLSVIPNEIKDEIEEAAAFFNDNYKVEYSGGKTYEVEIPDDAKWLEWEQPLSEQPELQAALEEDNISTYPYVDADGEIIYQLLADKLGGPDAASNWLAEKGFTGNRYLANNISRRKSRQGEGKDKFNYVVFDDQTPQIVRKYMKPSETTSAGFRRRGTDERSKNDARKQLWRNKTQDVWNPNDPNGIPVEKGGQAGPLAPIVKKYMRGTTPINPDDLTADDLIETENASKLLDRILQYNPTRVSIDEIEQAAIARGLDPSDVTRLVRMKPGKLSERIFLYDVAAEKLQTRLLNLEEDMLTNGITPEKQIRYLDTQAAFDQLVSNIFDFQAEIGRTLNTMRMANFTRKRVAMTAEGLRELLVANNDGALADPETFLKFMRNNAEKRAAEQELTKGKPLYGQQIMQYTSIPRALMSSFDLSAPMRQGITFIGNKEYWASFFKMFTMLGKSGRTNYDYLMRQIGKDENYSLMLKARLSFSELDGKLTNREEDFQTDLARKIPILGVGVAQSEQAYAGFLNKLRADMFNKFVNQYKDDNGNITIDEKTLLDIGSFVNSATGRAELKGSFRGVDLYDFTSAAPQLNQVFFSSRLIQSRFNMLNPIYYFNLDPKVRIAAAKEMVKMGTVLNLIAWSLMLIPGALDDDEYRFSLNPENENFLRFSQGDTSMSFDPRTTDFLKIKDKDTRFDIGGGYSQYLVFGARSSLWLSNLIAGTEIPEQKSTTGKTTKFEKGRYKTNYDDEAYRFFRNKLSPNVSYVFDMAHGEDVIGREFSFAGSALSRMVPMYLASMAELAEQEGLEKGVAYSVPAVFGVGVNTFVPKDRDPDQTLNPPEKYKKVPLEGEAKEWWEATLNNHFKTELFYQVQGLGVKEWREIDPGIQKNIVEEAKRKAKLLTEDEAEDYLVPRKD